MTTQSAAPANLDRLRGMQTTSTALELETVPQTGRKADQLRANLANIQMPPGFSIGLYAIVPAAEFFYEGLISPWLCWRSSWCQNPNQMADVAAYCGAVQIKVINVPGQ